MPAEAKSGCNYIKYVFRTFETNMLKYGEGDTRWQTENEDG